MFLLRKQEEKRREGGELDGCFFLCELRFSNIAQRINNSVGGSGKLAYSAQAGTWEPE